MPDFTLRHDGAKWWYEVPTSAGVRRGWRPTQGWAKAAARRHVPPTTIPCPVCAKPIDPVARQCEHCGEQLPIAPELANDTRAVAELGATRSARRARRVAPPTTAPAVPVAHPPVPVAPPTTAPSVPSAEPPVPVARPIASIEPPPLPTRTPARPAARIADPLPSRLPSRVPSGAPDQRAQWAHLPPPPDDPPVGSANPSTTDAAGPTGPALARTGRWAARTTSALLVLLVLAIVVTIAVLGYLGLHRPKATTRAASPLTPNPASDSPLSSAKGKPCVAMADPLPADAPAAQGVVGPAPTSLVIQDLGRGTGATVAPTGSVTVNFIGVTCSTGRIFASSYQTGAAVSVPLDEVISGWTAGVSGMKVGGQRLIAVPSDEAYGIAGSPPLVAPDEAVWFVVEVTGYTP